MRETFLWKSQMDSKIGHIRQLFVLNLVVRFKFRGKFFPKFQKHVVFQHRNKHSIVNRRVKRSIKIKFGILSQTWLWIVQKDTGDCTSELIVRGRRESTGFLPPYMYIVLAWLALGHKNVYRLRGKQRAIYQVCLLLDHRVNPGGLIFWEGRVVVEICA